MTWCRDNFFDIGLEIKNRNKRVYPNKNTASWHTQTAETTGFSSGSEKYSPVSLINHIICGLHVSLTCTPASPGEPFWDSSLPFDLSSLPSVQKNQTYTLFIACNFSPLVNMSNEFSSLESVTLNPPHFLYRSLSVRAVWSLAFCRLRRKKKKKKIHLSAPWPLTPAPDSAAAPWPSGPLRGGGVRVCSGQRFWSVPTSGGVVSWSDRVSPPIVPSVALSLVHSLVQPGPRLQSASPGGHKRHFTATMWDQHCWKSKFHCFCASSSMLLLI